MRDVAVVMGSANDSEVMSKAVDVLQSFRVSYDYVIVSAHRTPERLYRFAADAHQKFKVIIAGAGGAAHLPGMIASMTLLPVLGVPITSESLRGLDSLLSIVQMPKGVPVGTLAVDGAANAALLAIRILAIDNSALRMSLQQYRQDMETSVPDVPPDL